MLTHIYGAKCIGIDAVKVTVELEIERGIGLHLVGLADIAVKESLLRTITALQALGYKIPGKKIVINLAPADQRKHGSGYDLPIAVGIVAASGQKELPRLADYLIMGELGLDGSVRHVAGALPFAVLAKETGFKGVILPLESALEAAEIGDIDIYGVQSLAEVIEILEGKEDCPVPLLRDSALYRRMQRQKMRKRKSDADIDFADIIGQEGAKRGLEIAAAGGHNVLMIGAPGAGKSSLAKAVAGIMPPMSLKEALVTSKIYSVAGASRSGPGLIRERPFRAPHHTASPAAIIGGGSNEGIMPGEVSLADNGVLFLDELGQMPRSVIDALRAPIEDRKVTVSRLKTKVEFPASFMLVAATNPCPCGYYGEGDLCRCSPSRRLAYLSRISGPILDRIDIQVRMRSVPSQQIINAGKAEPSEKVARRVLLAREMQKRRYAGEGISTNAELSNRMIERYCPLSPECARVMEDIIVRRGLTMRAYFRIIKVARSIADLAQEPDITPAHLLEAASFRFLESLTREW